jgi:hypothetical protein
LPVDNVLHCRIVCSKWNAIITQSNLLEMKSCFVFDGRREDTNPAATKCSDYMETSETKNYLWSHLKFRRVGARQVAWIFDQIDRTPEVALTISTLELLNSTLNWATILQLLLECENLKVFIDKQDMYCWDYATFNGGIEENETILETQAYLNLKNRDKLDNLKKLRIVRIHRSQLTECTTYAKIFSLKCTHLKEIDITTDQNFAPQRGILFYTNLANLMRTAANHLRILRFPYDIMTPSYDFRTTDEHRLFRELLTFITDNRWAETLILPRLEELTIQYGIIPLEGQAGGELAQKLIPFLQSCGSLKRFCLGTVQVDSGQERILLDFLNQCGHNLNARFGILMSDAQGIPNINTLRVQNALSSLSIQTFRDQTRDMKEVIPMFGLEKFSDLKEFQYFIKNLSFRNFNFDLLTESFSNLTYLNIVDHNARLETRHSSEALATIEDNDFQLIIKSLTKLVTLQLIGNMTFLTDAGLTGIVTEGCKRMLKIGRYELLEGERIGVPVSHMKCINTKIDHECVCFD